MLEDCKQGMPGEAGRGEMGVLQSRGTPLPGRLLTGSPEESCCFTVPFRPCSAAAESVVKAVRGTFVFVCEQKRCDDIALFEKGRCLLE